METYGNKCNCYPLEEEEMNYTKVKPCRINKTQQHRLGDCYVPKNYWMDEKFENTSSSSSSSSSESDSEDEMINYPKMNQQWKKNMKYRHQQYLPREQQQVSTIFPEWYTVIHLEGVFPKEVIAKLNTKTRVLLIKAKITGNTSRFQHVPKEEMFFQGEKLVRVLPLPETIQIQKLRVKIFPTGEVIVKAPFIKSTEEILRQKKILRALPLWVPIPVSRTETPFFNKKHYSTHLTHSGYPLNRYPILGQQEELIFGERGHTMPMKKWNKMTTTSSRRQFYPTTITDNTLVNCFRPEVIRDEITGKWAMLFKVNTMGFQPEDVRVRVDESKNILIVEAVNKHMELFTSAQLECTMEEMFQNGLPVKYFRREFILPQGCIDMRHICYCVKEITGLLLIKVPLLKTTSTEDIFSTGVFGTEHNIRGLEKVEDVLQEVYHKWEKPLLA